MEVKGHWLGLPPVREHDAEAPPGPGIERGAQAGIEPATGGRVTQQIGSAKALRNMSTQCASRMRTSPSPVAETRTSRSAAGPARRAAPRSANVWTSDVPVWPEPRGRSLGDHGGLDARLDAGLVTDHRLQPQDPIRVRFCRGVRHRAVAPRRRAPGRRRERSEHAGGGPDSGTPLRRSRRGCNRVPPLIRWCSEGRSAQGLPAGALGCPRGLGHSRLETAQGPF